jgi:ribosomal 30S subunit maturation factor RimM
VVDGEKELLVPMVEGFIVDINIEKSTIKIKADDLFL